MNRKLTHDAGVEEMEPVVIRDSSVVVSPRLRDQALSSQRSVILD